MPEAPMDTGILWEDRFLTESATNEQSSLSMESHSLPEWEFSSLSPAVIANAQEFDSSHGAPPLVGHSSQLSTITPKPRSSTSSALQYQGDASAIWSSGIYSMPFLPPGGFSELPNINDPLVGTIEADFDVCTGISTNQLFLPAVGDTAQGYTKSLLYAKYTSDIYIE